MFFIGNSTDQAAEISETLKVRPRKDLNLFHVWPRGYFHISDLVSHQGFNFTIHAVGVSEMITKNKNGEGSSKDYMIDYAALEVLVFNFSFNSLVIIIFCCI